MGQSAASDVIWASSRARQPLAPVKVFETIDAADDLQRAISATRRYHEALVAHCGNQTKIMPARALETLWSVHEQGWSGRVSDNSVVPVDERLAVLEEHRRVIDAIEAGAATPDHRAARPGFGRNGRPHDGAPESLTRFLIFI